MSSLEDRARADAAERDGGTWGYRVQLEVGETFAGRYRGAELATGGDYGDQTLYLLWDRVGNECYMRGHASLVRRIEAANPAVGDSIVVARADDYTTANGTGYSYGVASEPNDEPLPEAPVAAEDEPW